MLNPFAWIRDMLGISKDAEERKKTILEIEALEARKRERESQIQWATLEDVKKYDPKVREIEEAASSSSVGAPQSEHWASESRIDGSGSGCLILLLLLAAAVVFLVWSC